jgi:hypothetical protein
VVCRLFGEQTSPLPTNDDGGTVAEWAERLVGRIALSLRAVAEVDEHAVGEYAATLVGAVVEGDRTVFVQVGDGIAVYRQGDCFEVAMRPEESEFINSTYFVTDPNVADHIQVRIVEGAIDEIALLTDGLQPLVLRTGDDQPHEKFFETVFRNIRAANGRDETASAWLANMLASDLVTSRTDDDTSILVARRMPGHVEVN